MSDHGRSPAEKYVDLIGRALRALRPYEQDVVIIGGFAATLYRQIAGFQDRGLAVRITQDLDIVVPEPLEVRSSTLLHTALTEAGLVQYTGLGLDNRAASHRYQLAEDGADRPAKVYVEFLVPMVGRQRDAPAKLQGATVLAQAVRFLDLLVCEPVVVTHPQHGSFRVPHPLAYVVQKTRIRPHRSPKAAKDQADAFVVIDGFQSQWALWRAVWLRWSEHAHYGPWLKDVERAWRDLYASPESAGSREVASIYRPHIDSTVVHSVMSEFLQLVPPAAEP